MAGLDPAIYALGDPTGSVSPEVVDHRVKPGDDEFTLKGEQFRNLIHPMESRGSSAAVIIARRMMRYAVVTEKAADNYSAYVPDLPGCIATGATVKETEQLIREAIELHLAGLRQDGWPLPQPSSQAEYVEVAA